MFIVNNKTTSVSVVDFEQVNVSWAYFQAFGNKSDETYLLATSRTIHMHKQDFLR